ncbi:MAG: cell division protein FtsX [Vicinamibacterales bacterium]
MSAARYSFDEAVASLRRSGRSATISIATIAVAFLTLGGFLVLLTNVEAAAARWAEAAEVSVYLEDTLSAESRAAIEQELRAMAAVADVVYVSKDDALRRFRENFPELSDIASGLDTNPFPASLEVRLRPENATADGGQSLAAIVSAQDGVVDVQFDQRWLTRVLAAVAAVRLFGLGMGAVLLTGAAFTVASVVRLSLVARRDELDIMELVGAPFAFVRGPFIAEGMLQGLAGALLALALLRFGYSMVVDRVGAGLTDLLGPGGLRFVGVSSAVLLIAAGLIVGALAGALASRTTASPTH